MKTFGERLRFAREHYGPSAMTFLSQAELADLTGIDVGQISHYECNRRKPSYDNIIKLCKALSESADHLLGIK